MVCLTLDVRPLTLDLKTEGFTREGCERRRRRCEMERQRNEARERSAPWSKPDGGGLGCAEEDRRHAQINKLMC